LYVFLSIDITGIIYFFIRKGFESLDFWVITQIFYADLY